MPVKIKRQEPDSHNFFIGDSVLRMRNILFTSAEGLACNSSVFGNTNDRIANSWDRIQAFLVIIFIERIKRENANHQTMYTQFIIQLII